MIANYHTHTYRCKHASGLDEEYCKCAIDSGLNILGFSDHTPYLFDEGYVSPIRMALDEFEQYVESIHGLSRKYKNKIDIRLGIEVEYYPKYFDKLMDFIKDYPVEYMILGQHFAGDEILGHYCGESTSSTAILEKYCRQSAEAFETGKFAYFAHPDLMFYTGDSSNYDKWMRWLCQKARDNDLPLEINLQGIWLNRNYPNERFWKIAGQEGNKVIIGSDAHKPRDVYRNDAYQYAMYLVNNYKLNLIDKL